MYCCLGKKNIKYKFVDKNLLPYFNKVDNSNKNIKNNYKNKPPFTLDEEFLNEEMYMRNLKQIEYDIDYKISQES